jgi:hypothetical protein
MNSNLNVSNNTNLNDLIVNNIYYNTINTLYDDNIKTNIMGTKLGLDFINQLNPVDFIINNNNHHGFISQDIKNINDLNFPVIFSGISNYNLNDNNILCLNMLEFICPIVKAIQELTNTINKIKIDNSLI